MYSAVRYFKIIDENHEDLELQLIYSILIFGFRFLIFLGGIFIQTHPSKVKKRFFYKTTVRIRFTEESEAEESEAYVE